MILGIDQATLSGWAVADEGGAIVASGTWNSADRNRTGESRGMRYVRFRRYLLEAIEKYNPRLIVHEQTLMRGGPATEVAAGFKATILSVAAESGIECTCVHATELKRFATGKGNATKEEMVYACTMKAGIVPVDDNEADAVLIAMWGALKYGLSTF